MSYNEMVDNNNPLHDFMTDEMRTFTRVHIGCDTYFLMNGIGQILAYTTDNKVWIASYNHNVQIDIDAYNPIDGEWVPPHSENIRIDIQDESN
ncbi:MAG: hypothetical protein JWP44_5005 [Mucilaginibacter sp.]|nr:hypothetical protein [Mucilaginibacter sp.]